MKLTDLIKAAQKDLGVTVDGDWGPVTSATAANFDIVDVVVKKKIIETAPSEIIAGGDYFGAPWVGIDLDLLGATETNPEYVRRLAPHWAKVGLPGYVKKGLSGSDRAHCALRVHYALWKVGIPTEKLNAGAYSLSAYGDKSPFWFGALLPIKHKSGGRHAAFFLYWIDEKKKICASIDSNRSNKFAVFATDLSGKGDVLVNGPRFPKGMTGQSPTMAQVLAKYPMLKVGGVGSSTR